MLKLKFEEKQFEKLADIISDIAAIAFASVAVPAFIDRPNPPGALAGLLVAFSFWILSLFIIKFKG